VKNTAQFTVTTKAFFYFIIFYTMIFQGAYFTTGLFILNIFFVLYILLHKKSFKMDLNFIVLSIILILSVLSNLFLSINYYTGLAELIKYSLFPLSYIVFSNTEEKEAIHNAFYHSFILLMLFGLLACLGFSIFPGMVIEKNNRLQSFLQYANTTALFMGIGILLSLDKYFLSKKKIYLLWSLMFAVALFLTQSRTTFVIFLFILTFYLFEFLNKKRKLTFISVCAIGLFVLFAAGERIVRISLVEPTLMERLITFYDAMKLLISRPFGIGLGNWQYMQFQYQSAPYQVRYIHNTYLQIALDCGLLAFICFLGLTAFVLIRNFRKSIHFYIFALIILQGLFEVSFNFGIVIIYFTLVLASLEKTIEFNKFVPLKFTINKKWRYLLVLPLLFLTVCLISEMYVSKGNREITYDKNKAYTLYVQAQKINPLNKDILFKKAQIEKNPMVALNLLEQCYEHNPYNFQVLLSLAEGYLFAENFEKSYFYANRLFEVFPYSKTHQQLVKKVLAEFRKKNMITEENYHALLTRLNESILEKNQHINPMYKYINAQMDYN